MVERRPDPDALLAQVREEQAERSRGKLTIFFGAAPGVGKTYAMLAAARGALEDERRDVVVGIVETHGRYDTGSLLIGQELLARRKVSHKGITLEELDIDGALARRPGVLLVDELAHTNAPGSRHLKRWQDVAEILDSGIDVFTTLNVQHLESLNDVVAQITGVVVRETVPDRVFDRAYEVRVVDLPVDELLDRLHEGKVYMPAQAARAMENFFREGNLIALRELALRRTAERVDAKMRGYKASHGIEETWHAGERVMVCVSGSPNSAHLIRAARRMATSLHAELVGLFVETPASLRMTTAARDRLAVHLRLVESLDGEPVVLRGEDAAKETVAYARKRNVTKIVLGKPTHARWRDYLGGSFLDDVVRQSHEIDLYVISGESTAEPGRSSHVEPRARTGSALGYGAAVFATTVAPAVSWYGFGPSKLTDVVMVYLLGVALVSMRFGYGPSLLAAVAAVLAFDFFFIPPFFDFSVSDFSHTLTFAVLFAVAMIISHLTTRIRDQADSARDRERRTASLYAVSREVGLAHTRDALLEAWSRHVRETFSVRVAVLLPDDDGHLFAALADEGTVTADERDVGVADWAWLHQQPAGATTDTLPSSRALFVPLRGPRGRVGVVGLYPSDPALLSTPDARLLLETLCGLVASALERNELAAEARKARLRAETEQLRSSLLSSVSHDLRTPLGVVTGATSALLDESGPKDEATRRELLQTAHEESLRLNRLVRNLLDMTRLEAGALRVQKEAQPFEEVVGGALTRLEDRLRGRQVRTDVPSDLPLAAFDAVLVEQVLVNLLENALKYTPPASPIDIEARERDGMLEVTVADQGPGVEPRDRERIFEKFYRAHEGQGGGVGLGLAICRGMVSAHGGQIRVEGRPGGGAAFRFTLPLADGIDTQRPDDETGLSEVARPEAERS
ncbi:MAG: ATP-binding protein [Polyangiaceae bacterium]